MIYSVTAHPLLSDQAAALSGPELDAHARVAESLLGLDTFTPFDPIQKTDFYNRATDAVALQVSYQVESGIEAFVMSGESRGARRRSYRGGSHRRMQPLHPTSRKIVSSLKLRAGITIV